MLSALAFSLPDIRLTSILIILDIAKRESNSLMPKSRQVYPKKWNTYGMGGKKWIICVAPDNIHTTNLGIMGGKRVLTMPKIWNILSYETQQKGYSWVRFVHECLGKKGGWKSRKLAVKRLKYGYFSGTTYWCEVHIVCKNNLELC